MRRIPAAFMMMTLCVGSASAECESRTGVADVVAAVEAFEKALEEGSANDFRQARDAINVATECLGERLDPPLIARYFRTMGLDSYATGRTDTSALWWTAARRLDPNAKLPIYPEGHQASNLYRSRDPDEVTLVRLQPPVGSPFVIDGSNTREFPLDVPTVVQRASGGVYDFQVLPIGKLPEYRRRRPVRIALLGVSAGSAIAGVGSWIAASSARSKFQNDELSFEQLVAWQRRANSRSAGAMLFGAVSITTATIAIVTKR